MEKGQDHSVVGRRAKRRLAQKIPEDTAHERKGGGAAVPAPLREERGARRNVTEVGGLCIAEARSCHVEREELAEKRGAHGVLRLANGTTRRSRRHRRRSDQLADPGLLRKAEDQNLVQERAVASKVVCVGGVSGGPSCWREIGEHRLARGAATQPPSGNLRTLCRSREHSPQ